MTPEQRQAARERCQKATPGPWTLDTFYYCYIWGPHMQMVADDGLDEGGTLTRMRGVGANLPLKDNGYFIAHARTDLPAALDALDAADKQIAELSEENSQMARMLAEPSENQELKARIAELEAEKAQLLKVGLNWMDKAVALEADKARLDWLQNAREDSAWSHFEICIDGGMDRYNAPGSVDWIEPPFSYSPNIRTAIDGAMNPKVKQC